MTIKMPKRTRSRSVSRKVKRIRTARRKRITRSMVSTNLHHFQRWGRPTDALVDETSSTYSIVNDGGLLTITNNVNEARMALSFSFADMQNYAEFSALYDQYKIKAILFTIKMINNPDATNQQGLNATPTATNYYPTMWYCVDHDDGNASGIAELRQRSRTKHVVLQPNREIRILIRPKVLTTLYAGLTSGYGLTSPYVDMNRVDVQHYGLHTAFDFEGLATPEAPAGKWQFRINTKYYFTCKNVR